MLRVQAHAPSNIAWAKYMGKAQGLEHLNIPTNPSISLCLNQLKTMAILEFEPQDSLDFEWKALSGKEAHHLGSWSGPWYEPKLSEEGLQKLKTAFFVFLKEGFPSFFPSWDESKILGRWSLKSGNTFPASSGIASSASSFCALTMGMSLILEQLMHANLEHALEQLSALSRRGSGSSCRSFEGPWIYWSCDPKKSFGQKIKTSVELPPLAHFVVIFSDEPKKVSSTQAHALVKTSPLWEHRPQRSYTLNERLLFLLQYGKASDWKELSILVWKEAWEMHSLFHTAEQPFSYWEPQTLRALQQIEPWVYSGDLVGVTLDAGPNLHISVPFHQKDSWRERLSTYFPRVQILEDEQGYGARAWLF